MANNAPIFSKAGDVSSNNGTGMAPTLTTGSNTYDGTAAAAALVYTSGAGGFIQRLRFKAIGTNVATVARIFINNGSTNGTAANNSFYGEISLPATTASATVATIEEDYVMNLAIPSGFRIYVLLATTVAAGWVVVPVAGQY
jgi:hypothetical protein